MADRAEERALETFPIDIQRTLEGEWDLNEESRDAFIQGYHQAEKDILFNNEKYHTVQVSILDELYDIKKKYEAEKDLVGEFNAGDRGMVDEIIVNLKRVENDYQIDLTREMEWLRGVEKKKCKVLALTWEDMHTIALIEDRLIHELCLDDKTLPQTKEFYTEVLKRFKSEKV